MNTYSEALHWIEKGIAAIPCGTHSKTAAIKWLPFQSRLPSDIELKRWFRFMPSLQRNLAIITGWQGLTVIDFDSLAAFASWYSMYPLQTYMVATGRGIHVYLSVKELVKSCKIEGLADIKAQGGYVLAPPSVHPSGAVYQVVNDDPILKIDQLSDVFPDGLLQGAQSTQGAGKAVLDLEDIKQALHIPIDQACGEDPWDTIDSPAHGVDLITRIRAEIPILSLLPGAKQTGDRWWMACCPLHDDHRPSMWVDVKRGICGCHACKMLAMDVVNLWSRCRNIGNREAIHELAGILRQE
jgi:hypothetical protein